MAMDQSGKNNPAYRHGHTHGGFSPTYYTWTSMMTRCYNEKAMHYARYGGRGIRVCIKWKRFEGFLADMGVRPVATSLDRIDSNKGYNLTNCRWASASVQAGNRARYRTDEHARRILRACRTPKQVADLPNKLGLHPEVIRKEVRWLRRNGYLWAVATKRGRAYTNTVGTTQKANSFSGKPRAWCAVKSCEHNGKRRNW